MLKFVMTLLGSVSPYADVLVFVFLMMFIVSQTKIFWPCEYHSSNLQEVGTEHSVVLLVVSLYIWPPYSWQCMPSLLFVTMKFKHHSNV